MLMTQLGPGLVSALVVAVGLEPSGIRIPRRLEGKFYRWEFLLKQNDLPFPVELSSTWFIFSAAAMRKFVENPP